MPKRYEKELNPALPLEVTPLHSTPENDATIALLERWAHEDISHDPAVIAEAQRELSELKAALNANRPADKPVFP